jgi:hypothetical protein
MVVAGFATAVAADLVASTKTPTLASRAARNGVFFTC